MHRLLAPLLLALPFAAVGVYEGPIFDAHLHYNGEARDAYPVGTVMELFSKNGVKAILANSRPNDGTRALYDANRKAPRGGFAVVPFIRVYRDRSDYGTWHANPDIANMIVEEEKRGHYRGVGEFHLFGREAASAVVKEIVNFAVAKNLVLHAHCDEEALELLFAHNPRARVIWAHTGFSTPLARVEELFGKYPQLWGELSYRGDVVEDGKLAPAWRAFFMKHPERFLAGSDTWVNERWQSYPQTMATYRKWLGELPADVAARIAWKNGARLFGLE
ncbi:MAG: amidohydrolase family protein [Betaproteobacteria bacterium]|nr:amidohydrolase family protein [Betaproteobacteria bacterium]